MVSKKLSITHVLRETPAIVLFEHKYLDSFVALRTGYRDINSLKSYQHLREETIFAQQQHLAASGCHLDWPSNTFNNTEESKKHIRRDDMVADQERSSGFSLASADSTAEMCFSGLRLKLCFLMFGVMTGKNINVTINYHRNRRRHGKKKWLILRKFFTVIASPTRGASISFLEF